MVIRQDVGEAQFLNSLRVRADRASVGADFCLREDHADSHESIV
jgi:hypothetical protein